jgi:hypothetical protein
MKLTAIVIS